MSAFANYVQDTQSFIDAVRPGDTVVRVDEDRGHIWIWRGGCAVNIVCAITGEDVDVYNTVEPAASIHEAICHAEYHAKNCFAENDDESSCK